MSCWGTTTRPDKPLVGLGVCARLARPAPVCADWGTSVWLERPMSLGTDVGPLTTRRALGEGTPRQIGPLLDHHGTEGQGD
jgi:hypothetical protein